MPGCAVAKCNNYTKSTQDSNIRYFRFPKDKELCKRWMIACRREDEINVKNAYICSVHFESVYFAEPTLKEKLLNYTSKTKRGLKQDAVPTLNIPGKENKGNSDRSSRMVKRRKISETIVSNNAMMDLDMNSYSFDVPTENGVKRSSDLLDKSLENDLTITITKEQKEILELKEKVKDLEQHNTKLQQKISSLEERIKHMEDMIGRIFTPGQIKKLFSSGNKRVKWSSEDITSAISLRSISPKTYRYLRLNKYPLPAFSTLQKWAAKFSINPGVLSDVLTLMSKKSPQMKEIEKLCILSFDEMFISNRIDIEKKAQQVVGPHKTCQTAIVRGICGNWKQPVFYSFDQPMTTDIMYSLISKLYEAGFIVVATVSDMGSSNIGLWKKMNIAHDNNCYFTHPSNELLKVFLFADVPHLIKLLRNHLLDNGFWLQNTFIDKICFEKLLDISSTELTLAHKITQFHFDLQGSNRQKVRPAVQLFSYTVSKAIEYCGQNNMMPANVPWKEAAEMTHLINDWFDLFNSKLKFMSNCPTKNAFGTNLESQNKLLQKMSNLIVNLKVGKHKSLIPFQKGILLSNRSLKELYDYLHANYNVNYILTSKLNQDVLENLFSYIRGMGACNDHPTPLDFAYRLKWFILGKNSSAVFTQSTNTEKCEEQCLLSPLSSNKPEVSSEDYCLTEQMLKGLCKNVETPKAAEDNFVDEDFLQSENPEINMPEDHIQLLEDFESKEKITQQSLNYIAGYVAYKFKHKYNLGSPTIKADLGLSKNNEWIHFISRGGLLEPCESLIEAAKILDAEFYKIHGNSLCKEKFIFDRVAKETSLKLGDSCKIPDEVIHCLSRTRTYIRLRLLNRQISFRNCKRKMDKKMQKFTNLKK